MVFLLAVTRTTAPLTLTWTCEAGGINGFWFPLFASPSGVPEMIQHQTPEASAAGTRRGAHSCCTATDYRLSLLLLFACCLQWGDHSLRIWRDQKPKNSCILFAFQNLSLSLHSSLHLRTITSVFLQYRPSHSTETALLQVANDISLALDRGYLWSLSLYLIRDWNLTPFITAKFWIPSHTPTSPEPLYAGLETT